MGSEGLHILVLTDREWTHPQGGGTGTNLRAQVRHWIEWGHRVTVVAAGYQGAPARARLDEAEVVRFGGRSTLFPRAILAGARGRLPAADAVLEIINGISFLTPLWLDTPRVALVHPIHREHYRQELGRVRGGAAAWALESTPLRRLYRGTRFITVSAAAARDVAAHGI